MFRSGSILALLLAFVALAAPAAGQDVLPTPEGGLQIDIGEPLAVAGSTIRDGSREIGTLEVNREGDSIVAVAIFERRAGRRARLCLTIGEERRCIRRDARRGLRLEKRWTAPFTADLVARARSGGARGLVAM